MESEPNGSPPKAQKVFSLFNPGVRDTTSSSSSKDTIPDPSTSSESSSKRSARHRAAKDKPVKYSFAPIDLTEVEEDAQQQPKPSPVASIPSSPAPTPYIQPITLNVKGTNRSGDQPTHSFFAKRVPKQQPTQSSQQSTGVQKAKAKPSKHLPLFPTAASQHVRSPDSHEQTLLCALQQLALPFSPRHKGKARATDPLDLPSTGLAQHLRQSATHTGQLHSTSKPDHQSIEATLAHLAAQSAYSDLPPFQAITQHPSNPSPASLWAHRWRPRKADQVLANAQLAKYLASWLRVLQITSKRSRDADADADTKDPQPAKKRFKRGGQRTVLNDDEPSSDSEESELITFFNQFNSRTTASASKRRHPIPDDEADDEQRQPQLPITTPHPAATHQETLLDFDPTNDLSNAILLTGPPGSGKTAAVHACAQEIGYEVFELNPGMGRRSKLDLHEAVGKVGRYHLVTSRGGTGASSSAMMSPVQSPLPNGASSSSSSSSSSAHRQSLILIEEVDILARDDVAFWAGVKELIDTSRRPVIMTCNDPAFVPMDDLPLQEVLHCHRPQRELAAEYLRFIAAAQGCGILTAEQVRVRCCIGVDGSDDSVDLRQAINQLQFTCSSDNSSSDTGQQDIQQHLQQPALLAPVTAPTSSSDAAAALQALRQIAFAFSHRSTLVDHFTRPHNRQAAIDDPSPRHAEPRDDSSKDDSAKRERDRETPPPLLPADELTLPATYRALHSQPTHEGASSVIVPTRGREDEYSQEYSRLVSSLTHDHQDVLSPLTLRARHFDFDRDLDRNLQDIRTFLQPHLHLPLTKHSSHHIALLYAPTLRRIIAIEDEQQALHRISCSSLGGGDGSVTQRGHRATRNSSNDFIRVFDVGREVLDAARRSASAFREMQSMAS